MNRVDEVRIQRDYYSKTADHYEQMHVDARDEHGFALGFMTSMFDYLEITSVLDIGCGTGRALRYIKKVRPDIRVVGVEPVRELREVGHSLGLSAAELIDGDATALPYQASAFDLVCEFAVLHHIRETQRVVDEMLRVAKIAVFISDSNNFGQGSALLRAFKQTANALGLWKAVDFVKTKGRGYSMSEGDGLAYSYSVYNNYQQIKRRCKTMHVVNTSDAGINPYRSAGQVALLGIK